MLPLELLLYSLLAITMSGSTGFAEVAKPLPVANKSGKTYTRAEVAKVGSIALHGAMYQAADSLHDLHSTTRRETAGLLSTLQSSQ